MVREGLAWAFTQFSVDYVDQQEEARRANRGVHAHDCVPGWESAPRLQLVRISHRGTPYRILKVCNT